MSKRLKKASHFIFLILDNNVDINKILISQANESHLSALAEIFQNILRFPLSKKKKFKIVGSLKLLNKYLVNTSNRRKILRKNKKKLLELLLMTKPFL